MSMPIEGLPLPSARRTRILEWLRAEGTARTIDLARQLDVNAATIRRDLRVIAREHPVQIVHGGAALTEQHLTGVLQEPALSTKEKENLAAKRKIARKAAELIENGETIALNAGSTVALILDYLPSKLTQVTVVTLALNVTIRAVDRPVVTLFLPGGYLRRSSGAFTGPTAVQVLQGINVDRAFLGAVAVDLEAGWTHPSHVEVDTNQLLIRAAKKRYLVADSSKFGKVAFATVGPLTDFHAFVVDDYFPPDVREWATAHDIEII